jgi:hypothetical protein
MITDKFASILKKFFISRIEYPCIAELILFSSNLKFSIKNGQRDYDLNKEAQKNVFFRDCLKTDDQELRLNIKQNCTGKSSVYVQGMKLLQYNTTFP